MFFIHSHGEEGDVRAQADELPGAHAPLRHAAAQLSRPPASATPSRRRCIATSSAGRCTACCASSTSPRTTRTSSARGADPGRDLRLVDYARPLRPVRARAAGRALDPARQRSSAPTRSGTSPRARSRRRSSNARSSTPSRGRRRVLRAEDRPAHDRRRSAARGRWGRSSSTRRCPRFGLTYMGADNSEHAPFVIHRALLGSLERFIGILIEHYGGAFPFWLAPVQARVLPVGEAHHEAARTLALRLREAGYRVEVADRPRRSASGSGPPSSTRSRSPSSTATARATRASPSASAAASSRR